MKELYYKTFIKDIEGDTNGKIFHVHGLEKLLLLKYSYHPNPSIDALPTKIPMVFSRDGKDNLKVHM